MRTIFVMLAILFIIVVSILYIIEKLILKKETSIKNIFNSTIISFLLSFISSIILMLLFQSFKKMEYLYLIPLITSVLFIFLTFIIYKTRAKFKNSSIVIAATFLFTMLYVNFNNSVNHKFLFMINRTTTPFEKVNDKIQNKYIVMFIDQSNSEQKITLKVLNKDIKIIQPKSTIQIEPNQKKKVNLLLESEYKNIKDMPISIEASNGSIKKVRKTIFSHP